MKDETALRRNQGWTAGGYIQTSLAVVGWLMKFINLSCLEQCRLCIEWHLNEVGELLNVCIVATPYPPILLPTKAIGSCLKVVRLKRSQGNQEGDKYRESELSG